MRATIGRSMRLPYFPLHVVVFPHLPLPIHVFEGVTAEVKTLVVPEGGELPPEEELEALEAAERAEEQAAAQAHEEAVRATEEALAEDELAGEEIEAELEPELEPDDAETD